MHSRDASMHNKPITTLSVSCMHEITPCAASSGSKPCASSSSSTCCLRQLRRPALRVRAHTRLAQGDGARCRRTDLRCCALVEAQTVCWPTQCFKRSALSQVKIFEPKAHHTLTSPWRYLRCIL